MLKRELLCLLVDATLGVSNIHRFNISNNLLKSNILPNQLSIFVIENNESSDKVPLVVTCLLYLMR